jgi:hypothetical protein
MSESFHVNFSFSSPVVLEKILNFPYVNTCKNSFPYCDPTQPPRGGGGNDFNKLPLLLHHKTFCFSDPMVPIFLHKHI